MARPHSSNSVFLAASGNLLLAYAINLVFHFVSDTMHFP